MSGQLPDDVTILRADPSISASLSGGGSGEADAPHVLKSRFVLEEKLGSGGMGTVYRAKDLRKVEARDRQPYLAIKVLNNDFREHPEAFIALQREAAKSQSLSHPNIVSIYDFDKDGDLPFMTMEMLEGQELAELLRAYPNGLPEAMAWDVIRGICAGLRHAHEAGIVHADFKPGNVYVSPSNSPKILDFGIARAVQMTDVHGEDTVFDPARLAALTPAYASREMLAGDNPEPRDDIYSLGIVIYLILTGHHPYGRMAAEDAAREALKPERPKTLRRRQWQVLQRCLAFNRQDRPQDIAEVEKYLLSPSPWPMRGGLAVAAVLLLVLTVNFFLGDVERREVEQEVRQTTLVDVQLTRLGALLDAPAFDANWEEAVLAEYQALQALEGADEAAARMSERIRAAYTRETLAAADPDQAIALLARAARFGDVAELARNVEERLLARSWALLEEARPEAGWLERLKAEAARIRAAFPDSRALAELDQAIVDTLEMLVQDSLAAGRIHEAELLYAELAPRLFDQVVADHLAGAMEDARRRAAAHDHAQALARESRARAAALDEALTASCLRIDLPRIASLIQAPPRGAGAQDKVAARLGECMTQLKEFDPDRAASLERNIRRTFGGRLEIAAVAMDPCGLGYLVGNGAQPGRQGYCADRLADERPGPRLVVLPTEDGNGRFAMTKQEVSWAQFRTFCIELEGCAPEELAQIHMDDRLPVTGISLATVQAFARWLSEATGYTYRLPTRSEWVWAAQGEPDPNRNCRVQIDGVERGEAPLPAAVGSANDYGLQNMLGNVQEWVLGEAGVVAVGGSYSDPISLCVATTEKPHDGRPAPDTGFRLVREVS